ncbi:uncharacterized protein LOC132340550 [Haemorhous mexicanus]|uniref:uncharacterized protein LOC132340550 n=1 Tax=Haemorhous mexicanus TaxID=30427 RepID=UPI0028BD3986|nr:uncharacterized protein LOC132340550 [Haemorhous mexicanus]
MAFRQLLEALVTVVATLGEVAATVTGSHRGVRRRVSPKFLPAALRRFTQSLRETLDHGDVTSLGHRGVLSLGRALAALGATPGTTRDDVRAAARAWRELVAALGKRWEQLKEEAAELCNTCWDAAPSRARDLWFEATFCKTVWDNLEATAWWPPVTLCNDEGASAGAVHDAQVAAASSEEEAATSEEEEATSETMDEAVVATIEEEEATSETMDEAVVATIEEEEATSETMDEAVVATSQARAATRTVHWAVVALGPLKRLVDVFGKAVEFTWVMHYQLEEIEDALQWTEELFPDVLEDLVAEAAKFERLWDASAHLASHHLLPTLWDIHALLLSPYGGPGGPSGPGGPGSRAVDERCQKAIEDIPKLLQG